MPVHRYLGIGSLNTCKPSRHLRHFRMSKKEGLIENVARNMFFYLVSHLLVAIYVLLLIKKTVDA